METQHLSKEKIEELAAFDSPTIANAVEAFEVRDQCEGFASLALRCLYPNYPSMLGYAITCVEDTASPGRKEDRDKYLNYELLYRAIEASPKPVVVVVKNIGSDLLRSDHLGDIMATIYHRLGSVGFVTDGGIRDVHGIFERAPGFQVFSAGTVVSHGIPRLVEIGTTVSICGLTIKPGDLLHGDANGLVSIPNIIADKVADQARKVLEIENRKLEFIKSPGFSLDAWGQKFGF
ncbi:MAG: RraA family protein [Chloroflexi bacterium]|nr:RraA family protein [Chloroflexota bacterium]